MDTLPQLWQDTLNEPMLLASVGYMALIGLVIVATGVKTIAQRRRLRP